jgi:hypothetical protein
MLLAQFAGLGGRMDAHRPHAIAPRSLNPQNQWT